MQINARLTLVIQSVQSPSSARCWPNLIPVANCLSQIYEMNYQDQINNFFAEFNKFFDEAAPLIIEETAIEYFKESFISKSFDGEKWPALSKNYKPKRGSMMVRTSALVNSIRPVVTTPSRVLISAGNSKVSYAKVHNEGGLVTRNTRSETFVRNRFGKGIKKGKFKRGTTPGQGFTFKASSYNMPQRQFMGHAKELNQRIINRIKAQYKLS